MPATTDHEPATTEPREIDEAWIEQAITHYQALERRQRDLADQLARADVTIRSGDGLVEVVVGADGAFHDVRIADAALRTLSARDLSRTVLAACQQARTAADWARQKLSEQAFGVDPFGG
jgi:DNA-binding protein YbaB